jgi:hypothetical protein
MNRTLRQNAGALAQPRREFYATRPPADPPSGSTRSEGQGAVLALPLCLEGLVFSPLAAAGHPGCRNLSARAERFRLNRHTQREEGNLLGLVEEVVGRVRHKRLITDVC